MKMISIEKELKENSYPGRGIIVGRSEDGKKAAIAYLLWEEVRTAATIFLWKTGKAFVHRHLIRQS